ncbi:hypothetical protein ASD45_08565 [Pseudolabrys sp. Root1462]|nr:hypothetical protein ASD45_08565 [Pseudolabrys sp. Root1462]
MWRADFDSIPVPDRESVLRWRAFEALLDAGSQAVVVPYRDLLYAPRADLAAAYSYDAVSIPHSDGTFFSDGTGYSQGAIVALSLSAFSLRSTQITIRIIAGGVLRPGMHFSIDHPTKRHRLYRIKQVTDFGGDYVCKFSPPMREAGRINTALEFNEPKCVMRLVSPDQMKLSMQYGLWSFPSVSFVETFVV